METFSNYFLKIIEYLFFSKYLFENHHYSPIFKRYFENVPKNIFPIFLNFMARFWHIFLVLKGIVGSFNGLVTVQFGVRGILCISTPKMYFSDFFHFRAPNWHIFLDLKGIVGSFNGLATVQFRVRGIL